MLCQWWDPKRVLISFVKGNFECYKKLIPLNAQFQTDLASAMGNEILNLKFICEAMWFMFTVFDSLELLVVWMGWVCHVQIRQKKYQSVESSLIIRTTNMQIRKGGGNKPFSDLWPRIARLLKGFHREEGNMSWEYWFWVE